MNAALSHDDYRTPQSDAREARLDAMADAFDAPSPPDWRVTVAKAQLIQIPCFQSEAIGMMTREQIVEMADALNKSDGNRLIAAMFAPVKAYADELIGPAASLEDVTHDEADAVEALLAKWKCYDAEEAEGVAA